MARGMNAHGITVAVSGYDLAPQVSIGEIIEQTQAACLFLWSVQQAHHGERAFRRRASRRLHGGDRLEGARASAPADLVPVGYAISGLFDLAPLLHLATNADFKLDAAEARRISPLFWPVARGRVLDAVVGGDGIVGVPAASQDHRRRVAREGRRDPLRGGARHEPFHGLRSDDRAGQRHDEALGGMAKPDLEPILPGEHRRQRGADHDNEPRA